MKEVQGKRKKAANKSSMKNQQEEADPLAVVDSQDAST